MGKLFFGLIAVFFISLASSSFAQVFTGGGGCLQNSDCLEAGHYCYCPSGGGPCSCEIIPNCFNNADCPFGQYCDCSNWPTCSCMASSCPSGSTCSRTFCYDSDTLAAQTCGSNVCQWQINTFYYSDCPSGTPFCYDTGGPGDAYCVECFTNNDCSAGKTCQNNQCVQPSLTCGASFGTCSGQNCCVNNGQPTGWICQSSVCDICALLGYYAHDGLGCCSDLTPDSNNICKKNSGEQCTSNSECINNDCNTFYSDADGDSYGNPDLAQSLMVCTGLSGYVQNFGDCDDTNANVHPGATEICNGIDDNCNGVTDEGCGETSCIDGIDNNGNGATDCADLACAGQPGPGGVICCQSVANCLPDDDCVAESCSISNICSYSNRPAGDTTECNTCQSCNVAGGNCIGITAETGKGCTSDCYDCISGTCTAMTENDDNGCTDDCSYCNAGTCTNRAACTAAECAAGSYCDTAGGNCQNPDASSSVCTNCATDLSSGFLWTWTPPNHQDAGKAYSTNTNAFTSLFNSDAGPCSAASGGTCFGAGNTPLNHKPPLVSGNCCGDDANEYYKPDYYGGECANNINDCIWSTGDAQQSDSGNSKWWCYLHEWKNCLDTTIGTSFGVAKCVGIIGNNQWNTIPLPENQYSCSDGLDNDADGLADCTDTDCNGVSGCCQSAANCAQSNCVIESCSGNTCSYSSRPICDATECPVGSYCDAAGGNCQNPDASSSVCTNCVLDTTVGAWTWTPSNHEDAGKGYSGSFFDSDGNACTAVSCIGKPGGCACFDTSNNPVNHKSAISGQYCCGDDGGEYYKSDYYGGECVNNINDCVWGTGDAQASNTGNAEYWCYLHEWGRCTDQTIGTSFGGAKCAGIIGNNKWTPTPLPENQYSCTDGLDNDADGAIDLADSDCAVPEICNDGIDNDFDGLIDCADTNCYGSIIGTVRNEGLQPIPSSNIEVKVDLATITSTTTNQAGTYNTGSVRCGSLNIVASHSDYSAQSKTVNLQPNQQATVDFNLVSGTSCEQDCTLVNDNTIHASCDDKNGCNFYDDVAESVCDYAQPGWVRDYDENNYIICAPGSPQPKYEIGASVTCSSGTLVKVVRIVLYNGKPVKLVVATCG